LDGAGARGADPAQRTCGAFPRCAVEADAGMIAGQKVHRLKNRFNVPFSNGNLL